MRVQDYNIEYFRFIRDEITKRIQIHFKLELAKFGLVGAVLAFLLKTQPPILVSPFLVPSILAFLIDITILGNLGWIRSAGAYVKQNIENDHPETINWEHDFAQSGGEWACFNAKGYRYGIWSIGVLLGIWGVFHMLYLLIFNHDFNMFDIFLFLTAIYFGIYTHKLIKHNLGKVNPPMGSAKRPSPIV